MPNTQYMRNAEYVFIILLFLLFFPVIYVFYLIIIHKNIIGGQIKFVFQFYVK